MELVGNFFSSLSIEQGASDLLLQTFLTAGPIPAGGSITVNRSVTIPAVSTPDVQFVVCADSKSQIVEVVDNDNCVTRFPRSSDP